MLTLIVLLVAPLVAGPAMVLGVRHLFALFVRQAADLFLAREIHRAWAMTLGTDVAAFNVSIFALAWWATVALCCLDVSGVFVAVPLAAGVGIAIVCTVLTVKARLTLDMREALMVGLLTFAGGNLPLIVLLPALFMLVNSQEMALANAELAE